MEAKKVYSFRLSSDAKLAIAVAAKERHCSEGEVIESWAIGSSGLTGNTGACDAPVAGSSPALPTKRAMFEAMKAKFGGEHPKVDTVGVTVAEGPTFPFKVQVMDDVWIIWQKGARFGYEIEGVGTGGFLGEKEANELWAKRIK